MSSQGVSGTTRSALRYHLESKFSLGVPPVPPVPLSWRQASPEKRDQISKDGYPVSFSRDDAHPL